MTMVPYHLLTTAISIVHGIANVASSLISSQTVWMPECSTWLALGSARSRPLITSGMVMITVYRECMARFGKGSR